MTSIETPQRSAVKSLTWRVIATITTIALVYIITGNITLATSIGAIEVVAKVIIYYLHDRVWNKIAWGVEE